MFENEIIIDGFRWATNGEGEGLFFWDDVHKTWQQVYGTCDFSVKGLKHPEDKIRRKVRSQDLAMYAGAVRSH